MKHAEAALRHAFRFFANDNSSYLGQIVRLSIPHYRGVVTTSIPLDSASLSKPDQGPTWGTHPGIDEAIVDPKNLRAAHKRN